MIVGIGTDLCVVARFEAMLARRPRLAERLLTETERALPVQSQAARFAAKEALAKALGTSAAGAPSFRLSGTVAERAAALGIGGVHLSISHDGGFATAVVVCES